MTTIRASAPGKVVLWGEYAVLEGAPALVMAVDRYARCTINTFCPEQPGWHFQAQGFSAVPVDLSAGELCSATPPPANSVAFPAWHVVRALTANTPLPDRGRVVTDTDGFYQRGRKLGLGSSAAISTALYGAFCRLLEVRAEFTQALALHRAIQGKAGSGVDVAAAYHGGLLRFQQGAVDAVAPLQDLQSRFIWTGTPASTTAHIRRFDEWKAGPDTTALAALCRASTELFHTSDLFSALQHYVHCLLTLDQSAKLGIFSAPHHYLLELALKHQVVYKPCGAGGGDIGVAFGSDPGRLSAFVSAASADFQELKLESAPHGIQATG